MSICVAAGAWGQNPKFSGFSILATPTIEIFRFRRRASRVTGNTLIKANYASVRQSRDSRHVTGTTWPKKVAAAPCSETAGAKKLKKFTETRFVAHYYACKFGLNRLRTDADIRQKAAITAIMENVVIAIYRLRPIQLLLLLHVQC